MGPPWAGRSRGSSQHPRGWVGSPGRLGCPRWPGLRPGSSRQVSQASRFSPPKVPGPRQAKIGSGIGVAGRGVGGGRITAAALTLLPGPRAASGPGDRPASPATRLGWSLPGLSARGGCRPHPLWVLRSGRSPSLAAKPRSAVSASVSVSHTGGLSFFETVERRSERERLVP